jgi:hypothetical protein
VTLTGTTAGLSAGQAIASLNSQLQTLGITAAVGNDGLLQFSSSNAFSVSAAAASAGAGIAGASSANNNANYNVSTLATAPSRRSRMATPLRLHNPAEPAPHSLP